MCLCRALVTACGIFVAACRLFSSSTRALECVGSVKARGLSCPVACEILVPRPGIKPRSPALEGEFVTTGPPGKPLLWGIFFRACLRKKMLLARMLSHVRIFYDPRTVALQVPLSVGFPRQEYWSGLPFPSSGDLPNPGIESRSPALAGRFFAIVPPGKSNFEGCRVHSGSNAVDSTSQASEHKVCL